MYNILPTCEESRALQYLQAMVAGIAAGGVGLQLSTDIAQCSGNDEVWYAAATQAHLLTPLPVIFLIFSKSKKKYFTRKSNLCEKKNQQSLFS